MRYACIGHRDYFENNFIEGHDSADNIRGFDYDHHSTYPFQCLLAYAPDVTLVFRPELYPARFIQMIPGIRIGFSSEPLPTYDKGGVERSEQTDIRERVYANVHLVAKCFDLFFHYDRRSAKWFEDRGIRVTGYRHLPIDCSVFHPIGGGERDIDFLFVGKATTYRLGVLDRLRILPFKFQWIEHGIVGNELADLYRRARCVLNVHADGREQFEVRVLMAAACGAAVLSEPLPFDDFPCHEAVRQGDVAGMSTEELHGVLRGAAAVTQWTNDNWQMLRKRLSTLEFVDDCVRQYLER
ncbi:MAG TPA: hypothetical protein VMW17_00960 [Candidatus Binatia bacterium]|nr:hypothetical protein [Candidatus Binatia bacterium]